MAVNWTQNDVNTALGSFGKRRWDTVLEIANEGEADGIGVALLIAFAIKETGLKNIVGDSGHGRGMMQIDDRAWGEWLSRIPGLRSGTWAGHTGHSAKYAGMVPYMSRSVMKAIDILRGNMAYAKKLGVPAALRLRVAIAGYNCGMGNAMAAYRRYGVSGIDRYTTGRDYSGDVLRLKEQVIKGAKARGWDLG